MHLYAKHKNMSACLGLLAKHCEEEEAECKAHPVKHGQELICAVTYLCDHPGCNLFHWDRLVCLKVIRVAELYWYVVDVVNMCSEWLHPCKHWKCDCHDNVHSVYRIQDWGLHSSAAEESGVDHNCVHRVSASGTWHLKQSQCLHLQGQEVWTSLLIFILLLLLLVLGYTTICVKIFNIVFTYFNLELHLSVYVSCFQFCYYYY